MKPDIIPIDNSNIEIIADLLYERSRTLKSYTEWKYRSDNGDRFTGVIAMINGKPIGCFGSIPRELKFSDGTMKQCGWFADWYVSPDARGMKIGELLLNTLSDYEPIMFGHPGPKIAQNICIKNGYKQIGFHSRRRLILRRWSYNWKRGSLFSGIVDKVKRKLSPGSKVILKQQGNDVDFKISPGADKENTVWSEFIQSENYKNWVLNQPVSKQFKRESGDWEGNGCIVKYFDEQLENGEKRRSVQFMSRRNILDIKEWNLFAENAKKAKQDYIEVFTTDQELDSLLHHMGAWNIYEAPIVVRGLDTKLIEFNIQPWDRENWTNLSHNILH